MNKEEFDKRFSQAFSDAIHSTDLSAMVLQELKKSGDEHGKISSENLATAVLFLSLQINKKVIQSVLSEFFQIDQ